ncbi:pyridoxal phosphate-dependent aminotransferase [Niallia sp. 01092]|uniref:pyridoxal phosphate-dependent aminotransferase n=1 Tax=Niallia sp. 01092 TaxID=3457759 RepID=UPI003FD10475
MTLKNANMIQNLKESKTLALLNKVLTLKQQGRDIIGLAGGEPDFDTPKNIIRAAESAMKSGFTHYVNLAGIPDLQTAISQKLLHENKANYEPSQIIVTPGGKAALYIALQSILNPGDEVIVINPAWVSYEPLITMLGGHTVFVDLDSEDDFTLKKEHLLEACSNRTKAIIINNPNNPTGRVLREEEISALKEIAVSKNLFVVSDEVYEKLVYGNHKFVCVASIPELAERTLTVQSFSKGHAMTGWRLGYLALPKDLVLGAKKIYGHILTCTNGFIQKAGIVALTDPDTQKEIQYMKEVYERRMNFVAARLNEIPGVHCPSSEGAFYLFPEIKFRDYTSIQLADYLLEEAGVAVTPGEAFGPQNKYHVRISCANSDQELEEAVIRIEKALCNND